MYPGFTAELEIITAYGAVFNRLFAAGSFRLKRLTGIGLQ
jgi:hypothetical protein